MSSSSSAICSVCQAWWKEKMVELDEQRSPTISFAFPRCMNACASTRAIGFEMGRTFPHIQEILLYDKLSLFFVEDLTRTFHHVKVLQMENICLEEPYVEMMAFTWKKTLRRIAVQCSSKHDKEYSKFLLQDVATLLNICSMITEVDLYIPGMTVSLLEEFVDATRGCESLRYLDLGYTRESFAQHGGNLVLRMLRAYPHLQYLNVNGALRDTKPEHMRHLQNFLQGHVSFRNLDLISDAPLLFRNMPRDIRDCLNTTVRNRKMIEFLTSLPLLVRRNKKHSQRSRRQLHRSIVWHTTTNVHANLTS